MRRLRNVPDIKDETDACVAAADEPEHVSRYVDDLHEVAERREIRSRIKTAEELLNDPNASIADVHAALKASQSARQSGLISAFDLIENHTELRPMIIQGLLREGEVGNLVSSPKIGKSWLAMHLSACVAAGLDWLKFPVAQGKVLYVDMELHKEDLSHRLREIIYANGIKQTAIGRQLMLLPLRGKKMDLTRLNRLLLQLAGHDFKLIVLDALYRLLPDGVSENSNSEICQIYNDIDSVAQSLNAGVVVVHHASKGDQSGKGVTDVGSGAGSQSRAVDSHIVLRHHKEEGCTVMDAAVRSWKPLEPVVLRWSYPRWEVAEGLDPKDLKTVQTTNEVRQESNDREGFEKIIRALRDSDKPMSQHALVGETRMSKDRFRRLVSMLIDDEVVEIDHVVKQEKGADWKYYSLSESAE